MHLDLRDLKKILIQPNIGLCRGNNKCMGENTLIEKSTQHSFIPKKHWNIQNTCSLKTLFFIHKLETLRVIVSQNQACI